jgi:hypothetical protein
MGEAWRWGVGDTIPFIYLGELFIWALGASEGRGMCMHICNIMSKKQTGLIDRPTFTQDFAISSNQTPHKQKYTIFHCIAIFLPDDIRSKQNSLSI